MTLKEHQSPTGGLNARGRAYFNRKDGSNLKAPTKDKKSKRRKSFCARMGAVKGAMSKNGKPTRKALALRKWDC